ncbi:glycosyl hydrolase [Plectosphaerella plurivora]|uniref:Glycosyl hydrolase n=1 Tax=Plectosphaerella plurivora TaxID=936078 RepID=A0A9P8V079_9PEZI|nr:glycosyl hydrolase [Plectosphaerella plurivora]
MDKFTNPVVYEDLPDPEVIRVGDLYYMSASSFHFSPGAPLLESRDLVNWEYIGHSVPELPPSERFTLDGKRPIAYNKGVWASTLKYRESNGVFYFYTSVQGTDSTYIFTSKSPRDDVWTAHPPIDRFYYDLGLLIDDDDTMYIAHGTGTIQVAQLSSDGMTEVFNKVVYQTDSYDEGARMYKINGAYYIWLTKEWDAQCVLKSTNGPFGPYEHRDVIKAMRAPVPGAAPPHQGGLVDTPDGQWYFMAFIDAYPTGRVPVLAPVTFSAEGWPSVVADYSIPKGQWLAQYPHISQNGPAGRPWTSRKLEFNQPRLEPYWEWNHNPDNSKWRVQDDQLVLETGTVTDSLHLATNTLTHRTVGPGSIITFCLDVSKMADGDRAGLSMFRDKSAYIGIHRTADSASLAVQWLNGRPAALDWKCISKGSIGAEVPLKDDRVWLRVTADCRAAHEGELATVPRKAVFGYSHDGLNFKQLGPAYELPKESSTFMGERFGLFNFATVALGGQVRLSHGNIEIWNPIKVYPS